jgi:hypothetical protein
MLYEEHDLQKYMFLLWAQTSFVSSQLALDSTGISALWMISEL